MADTSPSFTVTEHCLLAQHVREYHHATKAENIPLQLVAKEYRPVNQVVVEDAFTVIATHANGIAKEAYEPLWEELCKLFPGKIRAVWFADCTHQGASGVLNESNLGDDPNWFDHSRDLLLLINRFRDRMPRPLVGVGHSMGCAQLVQLALMHPRLLDSLVLLEPVIRQTPPPGPNAAMPSSYRPDSWPSRAEAEASFRKSKFFRSWDPRCLDALLRHGLRTSTDRDPGTTENSGRTVLTTTKAQEVWSYVRSNFARSDVTSADGSVLERRRTPDLAPANREYLFDRAEMIMTDQNLPHVRPAILWIFADRSSINSASENDDKLNRSGKGLGGSGGVAEGNVKAVTVRSSSHMLPFEKPLDCASIIGEWLSERQASFSDVEKWWARYDSRKSTTEMALSKEWMENVKHKEHTLRSGSKSKL